jgi:hypothetical protein
VLHAVRVLLLNVLVWFVIPSYLFSLLQNSQTSLPVSTTLIFTFGTIITALQVLGALTEGMAVSVPFNSGSYIASAYYVWVVLDGGKLSFSAQGLSLTLNFPVLVFLFIVPLLFNVIRFPLTYLLEMSEAAKAAKDTV